MVEDVHAEVFFLYLVGVQRIHVFHHQVPTGGGGGVGGVFQQFHHEAAFGVGDVGGKFPYLVAPSPFGVFKGHGQHFIGLQGLLQRDIA